METGKLRWATYCFDPYDRHNLFANENNYFWQALRSKLVCLLPICCPSCGHTFLTNQGRPIVTKEHDIEVSTADCYCIQIILYAPLGGVIPFQQVVL